MYRRVGTFSLHLEYYLPNLIELIKYKIDLFYLELLYYFSCRL